MSFEQASLAIEHYWAGALRQSGGRRRCRERLLMAGQRSAWCAGSSRSRRSWPSSSSRPSRRWHAAPRTRRRRRRRPDGGPGGRGNPEPAAERGGASSSRPRGCCSSGWSRSWPSRSRPQQRLDRIAELIAANLVAEVCSVYFNRAGDVLELFATDRPRPRGGAPHAHARRRRPGRHDRRPGQRHQHRRRPEPPELPLLPGDRRGDLPLVPGRADPARRAGRRRAHGPEPGAARLRRGRDRGDADHRLDPGRDVRLGRADRPDASMATSPPTPPPCAGSTGSGWSRGWRSAMPGCTSRGSR